MRSRLLSPEFWSDEKVNSVSDSAKLLFEGLWGIADREGRLEEKLPSIGLKVRPWDPLGVKPLLDELVTIGLVLRYPGSTGAKLLWLPNFLKHQKPHKRETLSRLPPHPQEGTTQGRPQGMTQGQPEVGPVPAGEDPVSVCDPVSVTDPVSVCDPRGAPSPRRPPPLEKLIAAMDKAFVHNRPGDKYPWQDKDRAVLRRLAAGYAPQLIVAKWLDATSPDRKDFPQRINTLRELEHHWTQVNPRRQVVAQFDKDFPEPVATGPPSNVVPIKAGGGSS